MQITPTSPTPSAPHSTPASRPAKDTFQRKSCLADSTEGRLCGVAATHLQGRRPCSALEGRAGCKCVAARAHGGAQGAGCSYAFAGAGALQRAGRPGGVQMCSGRGARRSASAGWRWWRGDEGRGRKKEAAVSGTYGRPRPYEREGPASEAQWEGRAVADCEGFRKQQPPFCGDSFASLGMTEERCTRNERNGRKRRGI